MKHNLSFKEYVYVASMLFGMFFGAGNLIFPVFMGQLAGSNVRGAIGGFLITGVGLPLLGVAALGISRSNGLFDLTSKINKPFGIFFTVVLYLTIGPFFAIPRCATTSYTVGIERLLPETNGRLYLFLFTVVFFGFAFYFSLRPGKILVWIGKVLNPCFLAFLGVLLIVSLLSPTAHIMEVAPSGAYVDKAFFTGFLEGYNTMDALAALAFGIIVIDVIRGLSVTEPKAVAKSTVKAGIFSSLIMAVIYVAVTVVGAQSRGVYQICANGGEVFALVARHYFGNVGAALLAITVTLACLKTSVGLVTSCAETFSKLFPKLFSYKIWAVIFSAVSFAIANFGLDAIIKYSIPVLMFLYPLAITLILLGLFGNSFKHAKCVYVSVTTFTLVSAVFDFLRALPENVIAFLHLEPIINFANKVLPFSEYGMGWVVPALLGLLLGLIIHFIGIKKLKKQNPGAFAVINS